MTTENGDSPAMPINYYDDYNDSKVALGLTKRETFAMNAPEMPEWFTGYFKSTDRGRQALKNGVGCDFLREMHFAWRSHFADSLLAELERTK